MTPRRRLAIGIGGALTLNGLILGALSHGHGRGTPALETDGLQESTIWLSLDPGSISHAGVRMARAGDDAPLIDDEGSSPQTRVVDAGPGPEPSRAFGAAPAAEPVPPIAAAGEPAVGDRIARSLRARLGCSPSRDALSVTEDGLCEGHRVHDAAPISGTGDPRRDRRLARQGARLLEAYAARRQRPGGEVRPLCEDAGPVSDCGVDVSIEIFSSVDGFFPGLRPDDDD